MKIDIKYLKDTFKIGYEAYEPSRTEASNIWDMYHNEQYTENQYAVLNRRGQPAETFNIVKLFTRMLLGYYSTIINTVKAEPVGFEDVPTANVLNDVIDYIMRESNAKDESEKVKLSGIVAGLMCIYVDVVPTGETDEYNRPHYKITLEHVPDSEIVLDPMSRRDDYLDARYIHRFKWVSEEHLNSLFSKSAINKLTAYYNFTSENDADYDIFGKDRATGVYKVYNNYLIVHSIVKDSNGDIWSWYWHDDIILDKRKLSYKEVKYPYRVIKTHTSKNNGYYGIYREVAETQKAINQALIKLQLLINSQKAYVEDGAVRSLADFTNAFNRVTAVIPVVDLSGIKIDSLSTEVLEQYAIIDKALDRVQRILGINDSFLGMAYASDSGRKVKLQQNASIMSLRYLTGRIETFYRFLGWDVANLIKQYYTSHQIIRIADDATGNRWLELNKPMQTFTGNLDSNGQPIMRVEYEEVLDPATKEPLIDKNGNRVIAPIPVPNTEIAYTKVDILIHANSYNDEDEKNQLMLEQVLAGAVGQLLAQVNPAGFFKAASLSMKSMKTKNAPEIANILNQTAQMLQQNPQAQQQAQQQAQGMPGQLAQQSGPQNGAKSKTLNLPQNTNPNL